MSALAPAEPAPTLRSAMRQLAGGVSLITVGSGAQRRGFTATSVTSLTLEPPCILACVNRKVSALPAILEARRFGVSVLAESHRDLAAHFSGSTGLNGAQRFTFGSWFDGEVPLLEDALATLDCKLEETIERHSHLILIGAVAAIRVGGAAAPLLYAQGTYGRFDARS